MYLNVDPNWKKIIPQKRLFLFGGGINGELAYHKIMSLGNCRIEAVIDNNEEVVKVFNSGRMWINKAYLLREYKNIRDDNDLIIITTAYREISIQLIDENIYHFVDFFKIDFLGEGEKHYDKKYFEMQLEYAKIDSEVDKYFFQKYISANAIVAEFGSGGGLLLDKIICAKKIGIEINKVAIEYAMNIGINSVQDIDDIDNESIDVVISSHALEHCLSPYEVICRLRKKLKQGGKMVFVVPHEPLSHGYMINNISQHLYNWTERSIGNLFSVAGFLIRETGIKEAAWPRNWQNLYNSLDHDTFNALSVLESYRRGYYSVYVVAEKT